MATTRFGPFPVSKGDVLTGIIVQSGDFIETIATGWVSFARIVGQSFNADGDDWRTPSSFPAPDLREHSLIVKFGSGPWFQGGIDRTIAVPIGESGEVVIRTNDDDNWLWDNDGFWQVTLVLTRPDPPPPPAGPPQPMLRIASMEVVQAIQRAGNAVPLVQGKRTIVRVFVDSGLRSGEDVGAGPNRWPGVTGSLQITDGTNGRTIGNVAAALNPTGQITARPGASIDREQWDHSLNFELPLDTLDRGLIDIRADISSTLPVAGPGGTATASVRVSLKSRTPQPLLPVLMALTNPAIAAPRPNMDQFNTAVMTGALPRYPVAEDGFVIHPPFFWDTGNDLRLHDLANPNGWGGLLQQLQTVRLISSDPVDGIRCALVPDGDWGWSGLGFAHIWGSRVPGFISVASDPLTFAHEMGHAFGLWHTSCNGTEGTPLDDSRPGRIDDVGLNVQTQTIIPKLTPDIMSYCPGEQWCSVQFFEAIYNTGVI